MKQFLRILLHISPLLPLVLGYTYGAIALGLFVGLCYVKVFKLRQQALDYAAKGDVKQEESVRKALTLWRSCTFLVDDAVKI